MVAALPHNQQDRDSAFAAIVSYIAAELPEDEEGAFEDFWGRFSSRRGELPDQLAGMSYDVMGTWFAFDYQLDIDLFVVDLVLDECELSPGGTRLPDRHAPHERQPLRSRRHGSGFVDHIAEHSR